MSIFCICCILHFVKFSACRGFLTPVHMYSSTYKNGSYVITSCIASDSISAPSRESTNTKIGGVKYFESFSKAKSLLFFDLSSTQRMTCLTSMFGALGAPTEIHAGLDKRLEDILSTDGGTVAENKSVCLTEGRFSRIK